MKEVIFVLIALPLSMLVSLGMTISTAREYRRTYPTSEEE